MAEQPDRDSQTEAPTAKRKQDAIKKGDVLQSRDLSAGLVVIAGVAWLTLFGPDVMAGIETSLELGLTVQREDVLAFDPWTRAVATLLPVAWPLTTLAAMTLLAAATGPALLGSLGFRSGAFAFKGSRIDPLAGAKRVFGKEGWVELGKSLVKLALILGGGWWVVSGAMSTLLGSAATSPHAAAALFGNEFLRLMLVLGAILAVLGLADAPLQWFKRQQRLRMSVQQVKEEHKESDGNPENKRHAQVRRHELLNGSARKAVSEANVVLTNPTHFAVALRYRPGKDAAPVVVARGRGETALAIRELAAATDVPRLEYPELTRAIYFTARAGQPVMPELYLAVATVLAFVFNLDTLAAGQQQPEIVVPEGRHYDEHGRRRG